MDEKTQLATFGAGCFWHVEDAFMKLPGVLKTSVGFMGGGVANPSYDLVCGGGTGHVEVTQIEYDSNKIKYEDLLNIFWNAHDPTQVDGQGPDIGQQYRSVIFYHTPEQLEAATRSKKVLEQSGKLSTRVSTVIEPADKFYRAEDYHQKYNAKLRGEM